MGASGWDYFTPYDDDIAAALESLRQRVFASGEYYREDESPGAGMSEAEYIASIGGRDDDDSGVKEFLLGIWREQSGRPPVTDADSLLAAQPE